MKPKKKPKCTCYCDAYKFPHRLLGGKCTEETATDYYLREIGGHCYGCRNRHSEYGLVSCKVADGATGDCPAINNALYYGTWPK